MNWGYLFGCGSGLYKCGGLAPIKATDEMTQPVGQRNGQLFTAPTGGGSGLPDVTGADNGKVLKVVNGVWALVYPNELPAVTSADDGKILKVIGGAWAPVDPDTGGVAVAGRRFRGRPDIDMPDTGTLNFGDDPEITYFYRRPGTEQALVQIIVTATKITYINENGNEIEAAVLDSGLQWNGDNNCQLIWFGDDAPALTEEQYNYLISIYEPLN